MAAAADLLGKSQLFSSLAPSHREQLAPHFTRHEFAASGDILPFFLRCYELLPQGGELYGARVYATFG